MPPPRRNKVPRTRVTAVRADPVAFRVPGALAFIALLVLATIVRADEPPAETLDGILARIKAPQFPNRDFVITDYGAAADADCTDAIRKAIDTCHAAGGGRVVVPAGVFRTGAV